MKITYHGIEPELRESIEVEFAHHVEKINRLLKRYDPEVVLLHATSEKTPHKPEFGLSLNLTLPTGTLHSTGLGSDVRAAAKVAFAEIETQLKKLQQKVRKDYTWKRKRPRTAEMVGPRAPAD